MPAKEVDMLRHCQGSAYRAFESSSPAAKANLFLAEVLEKIAGTCRHLQAPAAECNGETA